MAQHFRLASLLAILAFPILEIGLLIRVGQSMGFWRLALIVIATAMLGSAVIRRTGLSVLTRARAQMERGGRSFNPLFDGLLQLTAGMLLILPGLISDVIGLILLVPAARHVLVTHVLPRLFTVTTFSTDSGPATERDHHDRHETASGPFDASQDSGVTIEGEYERISETEVEPGRELKPRQRRSAH
jgi:UPF0716 protein FxsA